MGQTQAMLCRRLSSLGLKQTVVHGILNELTRWRSTQGAEMSVSRIKFLKQFVLRSWSGEAPPSQPGTWVDPFKGYFGYLVRQCLDTGLPFKRKVKCLNALLVYTTEVAGATPTTAQWNKFQKAVEREPIQVPPKEYSRILREATRFPVVETRKAPRALDRFPWSSSRRAPAFGRTVPETEFAEWEPAFFKSRVNRKLYAWYCDDHPVYGSHQQSIYPPSLVHAIRYGEEHPPYEDVVGYISFIQEPGYKLRAVANPYRQWQVMLEPMKDALLGVLKQIPEDHTHGQEKGVEKVAGWLKDGKRVYSLDLSSATDNFPLDLQLGVLRTVLGEEWSKSIELFHELSRAPWRVRDPKVGYRTIRWTQGQPLGLAPSFMSFAITHHAVARATLGASRYVILGDDICTYADPSEYLRTMEALGCSFSVDKSFASDRLAEFAGKIILPEGVIPTVKWREISDRNFVEYTRFFGHQFTGALRPRQRKVVESISSIPEWYGGLGWNPKGEPLSTRVDRAISLGLLDDKPDLLTKGRSTVPLPQLVAVGLGRKPLRGDPLQMVSADDRTDRLPAAPPRRMTLREYIDLRVGISRGTYSPAERPDLVPLVRTGGDPRGPTALTIWERRLARWSEDTAPSDEGDDVEPPAEVPRA